MEISIFALFSKWPIGLKDEKSAITYPVSNGDINLPVFELTGKITQSWEFLTSKNEMAIFFYYESVGQIVFITKIFWRALVYIRPANLHATFNEHTMNWFVHGVLEICSWSNKICSRPKSKSSLRDFLQLHFGTSDSFTRDYKHKAKIISVDCRYII